VDGDNPLELQGSLSRLYFGLFLRPCLFSISPRTKL
jgi:hypothetical protein